MPRYSSEQILSAELIATRFALPRAAAEWVSRPQLLRQFNHAIKHTCTLITAPAGSGKTALLAMGCEQQQKQGWHIAWLSLESSEHDPARFWLYVLTAIERAIPGVAEAALRSIQSPHLSYLPAIETILTPLINALAEQSILLLLVLDDYHLVADSAANEIDGGLLFLIQHMPHTLRLVISSRTEPALPLTRLRVQGHLAEIRWEALSFSEAEAGTFLQHALPGKTTLTPEQIALLTERTEGWVAGLQLAALSLSKQTDVASFIAHFAGSNRYIGEYLMSEVIAGLPPDRQDFLLRTAILPRMCGALCDAITGRNDGQKIVEELEAANLFVLPLDQEQHWYRYQHLFAEMLIERLKRQHPSLLIESHERAAAWFAAQRSMQEAIRHALAAQAYVLAASLIEKEVDPMLQRGELVTVRTWLCTLPVALLDANLHLSLSYILVLLMLGEYANASKALQHLEITHPPDQMTPPLRGELATAQAFIALGNSEITLAIKLAQEALQCLPPEQGIVRDLASFLYGTTMLLVQENPTGSLHILTQTAQASMRQGSYLVASFALGNRVLKEIAQGRLHQAERTCQEVLHLATQPANQGLFFVGWAHLYLGHIYLEWNQIERAREALERGNAQTFQFKEMVIDGYIALARIYDLSGERERLHEILDEIERIAQAGQFAAHTAWQVGAFRAHLLCRWGNVAEAARWAEQYEKSTEQTRQNSSSVLYEFSDLVLARIQMAQKRYDVAHSLLERLQEMARSAGRGRLFIEAALLLTQIEHIKGRTDRAMILLADVLQLAAPEGFVRLFLDEGQPMIDLLSRYLTTRAITAERHAATVEYARFLLEQNGHATSTDRQGMLPEMLSSRELDILRLLATGKSNDAIATELVLALSTVKWHITHLYRKLGVSTRVQAVARARTLKLIKE